MSRVRSFDTPHKGLRSLLSKFSLLAGITDYSDPAELERLKRLGNDLFTFLTEHAHVENSILLEALEQRCPGASSHDRHDHEVIEQMQESLMHSLSVMQAETAAVRAHEFYLAFSRFHSLYLDHIHWEETQTEKLFWEFFSDEELLELRAKITQSFSMETLLLSMKYILPAQSPAERLQLLSAFKSKAPEPVFRMVMETIRPEMEAPAFALLDSALNAPAALANTL